MFSSETYRKQQHDEHKNAVIRFVCGVVAVVVRCMETCVTRTDMCVIDCWAKD